MTRRFSADQNVIAKWSRKRGAYIARVVCLTIMFPILLALMQDKKFLYELAWKLDAKVSTIETVGYFAIFAIIVGLIVDVALLILSGKKLECLRKSYIEISGTHINGMAFFSDIRPNAPFSVPISRVRAASGAMGEELNLTLTTLDYTYQCLAIQDAGLAASLINEEVMKQRENVN